MTEALWFVLLIWSLTSKRTRPQGVLLFLLWFWTYAVIMACNFAHVAFVQVVAIDFIVAPLSFWFAWEYRRQPWGWMIAGLHLVYIVQHSAFAAVWFDMAPMSRAVFTVQCFIVAGIATLDARRAWRRKRYIRDHLPPEKPAYVDRWQT